MSNPCGGEGLPQTIHTEENYCAGELRRCRGCGVPVCLKHRNDADYCSTCNAQNGQLANKLTAMFEAERSFHKPCLAAELFGSFMDGLGERPASRELIETECIWDVMGVLG